MNTIKLLLIIVLMGYMHSAISQIGPVSFIDSSYATSGLSMFASTDIDKDGDIEIIATYTGSSGKLSYFDNLLPNNFSTVMSVIDEIPFLTGLAVGDFNNDNWDDIVAIGGIENGAWVYFNNLGVFSEPDTIDTNMSLIMNDVVVADFDLSNGDDIVIIGQHSIDFFRNNGNGNFTKEAILTTQTSSTVLECLDIAVADMDADGDMDLVCAETAGLVVYENSGNAVFTPHYYSVITEVGWVLHPFDIDNDNDIDVMMNTGAGDVKYFSNNGSGVLTFEQTLGTLPDLKAIESIDYNNDGYLDIYASYLHNVSVFLNSSEHTFETEVPIYNDNGLVMGPIHLTNLNNQHFNDYVWAGVIKSIGYHLNMLDTSIELSVRNAEVANKIYDGTANAVITGATLTGVEPDDNVFIDTIVARFSSKTIGLQKKVNVNISIAGTHANKYRINQPTGLTANITSKELTISNAIVSNKIYDGTNSASILGAKLVGVVDGDDVFLDDTLGWFENKQVGVLKQVTSTLSIEGIDAINYTLKQPTGLTASIIKKELTVGGIEVIHKTYDATKNIEIQSTGLRGMILNDDMAIDVIKGEMADKNAGQLKELDITVSLKGSDTINYELIAPDGFTANVSPKTLTLLGSFTVYDKEYDQTRNATIVENNLFIDGIIDTDEVILVNIKASYSQSAIGDSIPVTITHAELVGKHALNYMLSLTKAPTTFANIFNPVAVNVHDDSHISVFPNPFINCIEIGVPSQIQSIFVTSITGTTVYYSSKLHVNRLYLGNLTQGTYLIHVELKGGARKTFKILKSRQ